MVGRLRTTDYGRRTTDDGLRTTDYGRRAVSHALYLSSIFFPRTKVRKHPRFLDTNLTETPTAHSSKIVQPHYDLVRGFAAMLIAATLLPSFVGCDCGKNRIAAVVIVNQKGMPFIKKETAAPKNVSLFLAAKAIGQDDKEITEVEFIWSAEPANIFVVAATEGGGANITGKVDWFDTDPTGRFEPEAVIKSCVDKVCGDLAAKSVLNLVGDWEIVWTIDGGSPGSPYPVNISQDSRKVIINDGTFGAISLELNGNKLVLIGGGPTGASLNGEALTPMTISGDFDLRDSFDENAPRIRGTWQAKKIPTP